MCALASQYVQISVFFRILPNYEWLKTLLHKPNMFGKFFSNYTHIWVYLIEVMWELGKVKERLREICES